MYAIIGLGNPGPRFSGTRHNIGFMILDALAAQYSGQWHVKQQHEEAQIVLNDEEVLLIKPQTFMNNSGQVVPYLKKRGIEPDQTLVVHDELELPFGKLAVKLGGSARGHNGLKSLIQYWGTDEFYRLRFGIGRPELKEQVADYVLERFTQDVRPFITQAIDLIIKLREP